MDVLLEKEAGIATVTLNREKVFNALNSNVISRLSQIFEDLETDESLRVVIITGAGEKSFAAGADLKEVQKAVENRPGMIEKGQKVFSVIRHFSRPVIAAVNGYALGGGLELALSCDIRIASENAKFSLPEATLGLMPGYGGTQLLAGLIGPGMAKYMMFSGEMVSAEQALQLGIVEKVCETEHFLAEVNAVAQKISAAGPLAVTAIKKAVNGGVGFFMDEAIAHEFKQYTQIALSKDAEAGMTAFLNKKPPVFQGK